MRLSAQYNKVNIITSIIVLLITGVIYYVFIHLILTNKLDQDLAVEENEIRQYTATYQKLPLPASYLDQQVVFTELGVKQPTREFLNTTYKKQKKHRSASGKIRYEIEPGRSLITTVNVHGKTILVTITKSRVEAEDLVRVILLITLVVTIVLLLTLSTVNRFMLNRLWQPFYHTLNRMKSFEITKTDHIKVELTKIDEFNELNQSVSAMAKKVQQDYATLKNFTDNASHEMMTPLAVINSKLDTLLQTDNFTDKQGALLEDVYHATSRLSRLHQTLLLLAKIENNLIPDAQEINLQELIESKVRQFEELFERDQLQVTVETAPVDLKMSRYLADILLNNLFNNAVRHNIRRGSIDVKLTSTSLSISNTGKNEALNASIFDRFSKSTSSEGMGLGLAISKQICNLYGYVMEYNQVSDNHVFMIYFKRNI